MMNKQDYIKQIVDALAWLSRNVEINASLNLTDKNIHAEDFYCELLNLSFGYELKNINTINPNAAAIDLGDSKNKIAIQVTSTSALKKTRDTVEKFIEKELYTDYQRLIILNLVKVTQHKQLLVGDVDKYQLNTKEDIWDYNHLARKISGKDTKTLKEIVDFLHQELRLVPDSKLPKEVQTIVTLIDHLSNCMKSEINEKFLEEPDPDGKINERFSQHSTFLTETFVELYSVYGSNLEIVKEVTDIGTVQIVKKSLYLKSYSDKILVECGGNPKKALDILTQEFARVVA